MLSIKFFSVTERCTNTDRGLKDAKGNGCSEYQPTWCTLYDEGDFVSTKLCCVCGGGARPKSAGMD